MSFKESYDDAHSPSVEKFKQVILSAGIPSHAMEIVKRAMGNLTGLDSGTQEYSNTLTYIDYLVRLPWNSKTPDSQNLDKLPGALNEALNNSPDIVSIIHDNIASKMLKKNNRVKILIVDDEKIALKSLSHLLRKQGYDVETCETGEDAVVNLQKVEFDIVITDLRMANIDGIQVLEKAKSLYPDTHVILITGYATTETAVEAMRKDAFHYIMKPVQIEELQVIIKEALSRKKSHHNEKALLCLTCSSEARKADIGKAIAEATGRKFVEISLNNIKEETELLGLSRKNGGSSPGCIIKNVCKTGTSNPVIMLHDIDKFDNSLFPILHSALSTEKNRFFVDQYLEAAFDLSDVIFIATAGNVEDIDSALIESLDVVQL
jgi:ATP-dependent Lon protease